MWPRPVEAVVFDMDGLLFDTERVWFEAMVAVAPDFGVEAELPLFQSLIGLPVGPSTALVAQRYGPQFPVDAFLTAIGDRAKVINTAGVVLKAGVVELLDRLDETGIPRAICTSSGRHTVERNLRGHGLMDRFQAIVAHGDYANGKPHPEPFLTAAARLGVDPRACLALEDSHNGVRAACAAGMMTVMAPDMLEATDEMRGLCLRIVGTLHEVRDLL